MDNHKFVDKSSDITVDTTGVIPKELKDKAYKMTEAASIRRFYVNLAKKETGTKNLENRAYKLVRDRNSKEGVKFDPNENVFTGRDPEMVVDLINIKIKYAKRAEESSKKEYDAAMRIVEEKVEKGTRKWRKLRQKLQRYKNNLWKDLGKKYYGKVEKLVKKYNAKKVEKKTREEESSVHQVAMYSIKCLDFKIKQIICFSLSCIISLKMYLVCFYRYHHTMTLNL